MHQNGQIYSIHESLTNKNINTWIFRNITHASSETHQNYAKYAKHAYHDHTYDPSKVNR